MSLYVPILLSFITGSPTGPPIGFLPFPEVLYLIGLPVILILLNKKPEKGKEPQAKEPAEHNPDTLIHTTQKLHHQLINIRPLLEQLLHVKNLPQHVLTETEHTLSNTNYLISLLAVLTQRTGNLPKIQKNKPGTDQEADQLFIANCIRVIEQNLNNTEFTVMDLSRELGLSRAQLFRKLKSVRGETPQKFIYSLRLKKALQLLKSKKYSIAEAGYMTGFSNPSSFSTTFKKTFGRSPKAFLKKTDE